MNTRIKTEIIISGINPHLAEAIRKALEPDNTSIPESISIKIVEEEDKIRIIVEYMGSPRNILTLRNTVDDLLEHLNIAVKAIESVKNN